MEIIPSGPLIPDVGFAPNKIFAMHWNRAPVKSSPDAAPFWQAVIRPGSQPIQLINWKECSNFKPSSKAGNFLDKACKEGILILPTSRSLFNPTLKWRPK